MPAPALSKSTKLRLRIAFYALPLVLVGAILALNLYIRKHTPDSSWINVDWAGLEEVDLLQRYLQIDSSHPDGDELPAAEFLAAILAKEGIPATIERIAPRSANLWARLEGDDPRALALHHHMDVENPWGLELWDRPPFSGSIEPPWIYGRGAFDMKSYGIAQLLAVLHLKREGIPLRRSVMLLATGDEERFGVYGARYWLGAHPDEAARIWGLLTEGGAIEAIDLDRIRYWGTEFIQRGYFRIRVCHSEFEPMQALWEYLGAGTFRYSPRRVVPGLDEFWKRYGATRDREATRRLLGDPAKMPTALRSFPYHEIDPNLPPYIDQMLRDQMSVLRPRQVGGDWVIDISLNPLPGKSFDTIREEMLGDALDGYNYTVDAWYDRATGSPLDHPLFVELDRYMQEARPDTVHGPLFVPGAVSEARYFRLAGIPTYGFSPFVLLSGDSIGMKGANERLPLREYVAGVELYRGLVERLVGRRAQGRG